MTDPYLANFGFSLGINDVIPGPVLSSRKDDMVEEAYDKCNELIALAKKGKLENKAGCNQEQTLEAMISGVLSKVRDNVGDLWYAGTQSVQRACNDGYMWFKR